LIYYINFGYNNLSTMEAIRHLTFDLVPRRAKRTTICRNYTTSDKTIDV